MIRQSNKISQHPNTGRVAFFLGYGWLGISTPPLMSALYLANHNRHVDIFASHNRTCDMLGICRPLLEHPHIEFIFDDTVAHERSNVFIDDNVPIPAQHHNSVRLARQSGRRYDWVVGFDPDGLLRAAAFAQAATIPYIYHSLELHENTPIKHLEMLCQQHALFTITQDAPRADWLARINNTDRNNILILPNSSIGDILPERDAYFRTLFPAIGDRRIVLVCGTLLPECCIDSILLSTEKWPEEYVLVLHGWIPDDNFAHSVKRFIGQRRNIFLSTHILPPAEKFRIFQAADICLAFYAPTSTNLKYAAGSSGKIYDAMRCGTPLIGNDIPGMASLLQDTGCGIVVQDASGIGAVLPVLSRYHERFRNNCFACFPHYEFSRAYKSLLHDMGLDDE